MFSLSEKTKKNIERTIQITFDNLVMLTSEEEKHQVEKITGSKLVFSKERKQGIFGRGNPLLSRRQIKTMDDVDQGINHLLGIE